MGAGTMDQRRRGLAVSIVGHPDDGDVVNPVQPGDGALEFGGVNVEAARDDDVLEPADDT